MKIHARSLLTPSGWRENQVVEIGDGRIVSVAPGTAGDRTCETLTPGLFDVHCHGGEAFYANHDDPEGLKRYLHRQARLGITDVLFCPSTMADYAGPMALARRAMGEQQAGALGGALIRGVHLEGPFLSRKRPGAMRPEMMPEPGVEAFRERFGKDRDIIRLVTVAPENEGAKELITWLLAQGIRVQAGHTDATFDQAQEAFSWGVNSLCHTFNAARGIHHREPGVVTAALLDENVYCETICDFKHLHPGTIQLIYRMKGPNRMVIISDSVNVTGLPDGEHVIDGETYLVIDGTRRVNGGNTLSGGACYMDQAVRNLISLGIPAADVFRMASRTPAERMGIGDMGCIQPGMRAHLAAWDGGWNNEFTVIDRNIYERE